MGIEEDFKAETNLFADAIRKISQDEGLDQTIVQMTAWAAKKKNLGPWTQPDVCRISVQNLMYLKQKIVELTTYEIKPSVCGVHGVYEAFARTRIVDVLITLEKTGVASGHVISD